MGGLQDHTTVNIREPSGGRKKESIGIDALSLPPSPPIPTFVDLGDGFVTLVDPDSIMEN